MAARPRTHDLPHRAYIEALAEAPEGTAAWHLTVAGYAALQLFEDWMEGGMRAPAPSALELRRVRHLVGVVPELHPGHRCLAELVDSIEATTVEPNVETQESLCAATGRMLASYAKLLQYEGRWGLAADVHATIVEFARRTSDAPRMLDSMLMRGNALRMQGRLDEASDAYASLRAAAAATDYVRYWLESHLADARIAVDRGNIALARELQDRTIAEARVAERWMVVSKGLTDRARVAAIQRDFELALVCSYEAFELARDAVDRERILSNIALTFSQLGLRDAARDAATLVAATAQDRNTRLTALVNLMELAYQEGQGLVFEHHRRELAREQLPPYLKAVYLEACAEGYRALGRSSEVRHAVQRLLDVAERYGLSEFMPKAEALLRDEAVSVARDAIEPPTQRAQSIARAITQMRSDAGLPG